MAWFFTPPQYDLKPVNTHRLLTFYNIPHAYTVLKRGSSYESIIAPPNEDWRDDTIDFIYMGGHLYEITAEEAALLTAAGYQPYED